MNVNEMKPGRELDALVAEKVMGWRRVSEGEPYFWPTPEMMNRIKEQYPDVLAVDYFPAPLFSTDIAASWEVVEKLQGDGFWWSGAYKTYELSDGTESDPLYYSRFRCVRGGVRGDHYAYARSMPYARCLAALKTVTNED